MSDRVTDKRIFNLMRENKEWVCRYGDAATLTGIFDRLDSIKQREVVRKALLSRDSDLRDVGSWLLLRIGGPWASWISDEERSHAIEGLRVLGLKNISREPIINSLFSEDQQLRSQCALYLIERGEEIHDNKIRAQLLSIVEEIVDDPRAKVDDLAKSLEALAHLAGGQYLSKYLKYCKHHSASVRQAAISALLACDRTDRVERSLSEALNDDDYIVRQVALEGIGTFSPNILRLLEDEDNIVRSKARAAFQKLANTQQHFQMLVPYLHSTKEDTALWVIQTLTSHKYASAIEPLRSIVTEGNRIASAARWEEFIKNSAIGAILAVGGTIATSIIFIIAILIGKGLVLLWSWLTGSSFLINLSILSAAKWGLVIGAILSVTAAIAIIARSLLKNYRSKRTVVAAQALRTLRRSQKSSKTKYAFQLSEVRDMSHNKIELSNKYSNQQYDYEINYPQEWIVIEANPKQVHLALSGTPKKFVGRPGVTAVYIMVGEPKQPFVKEELIESAKGPVHKPLGDYQVISRNPFITRSGDEGTLFEFQFTVGAFSFRSVEGIIVKGNRVYSVEATTLEGNYGQYNTLFKSIISSIYLK